ncbi:MAG: hypothetical protein LBP35_02035 [Candidatus Ancillula trichonymphae]|nr:hypothetical protein [Candidatus Ancillula trichonymphae]
MSAPAKHDIFDYYEDQDQLDSQILHAVLSERDAFAPDQFTHAVGCALNGESLSPQGFKALLSPEAAPFFSRKLRVQPEE